MAQLFWLSGGQLERIRPFFLKERGVRPVDDGEVLSGTSACSGTACPGWMPRLDAPAAGGPRKTLDNRFRRWSDKVGFQLIVFELAGSDGKQAEEVLMVDATDFKARYPVSGLKKGMMRLDGSVAHQGGTNQ